MIFVTISLEQCVELRKSETYQNLKRLLKNELETAGKYMLYAQIAKEEGYHQIGNVFEELSENELSHAVMWFRHMNDGELPSTLDNIKEAYDKEKHMWTKVYQDCMKTARKEGFRNLADLFSEVGNIERNHDYKLEKIAENMEKNQIFCKDEKVIWSCMKCGYLLYGKCSPQTCPICEVNQELFEVYCAEYLR